MPNFLKIATKGAELGFRTGSFVAGQAYRRAKSLLDRDGADDRTRYAPTQPPAAQPSPAQPAKLESVPAPAPAAPARDITAKPSTGASKGGTETTVKASARTGARSAGGRISNPKAARKVRARTAAAAKTAEAKGKGGRPAAVKAENSPADLAEAKQGKQAAPLGSTDA